MLKLCRVTKVKVLFPALVYVLTYWNNFGWCNFNLFEFSAAILEKDLYRVELDDVSNTKGNNKTQT